jgi:DNA-directed RNA polymerase subunit M/transcription elongation factor TFIIS
MTIKINCPSCEATFQVREQYAGKKMKCPKCSAVVTVPSAEPEEEDAIQTAPAARRTNVAAGDPELLNPEPETARTRACPECGKQISATATTCRFCKTLLEPAEDEGEADEERDEEPERRRSKFKPCPRCGARGAKRVLWTPWGSFYGPAMFTHVRCPECGYGYNGKTGGSNLIPAIIFVTVPLIGIILILVGLGFVLYLKLVVGK